MNTRRFMTWAIFWSSVALALGALAWVSVEVVALEAREATAQAQAARQETIRRALWRMDSRMAPILAIEAARPQSDYTSLDGSSTEWIRQAGIDTRGNLGVPISPNLYYANSYFNFVQDEDDPASDPAPLTLTIRSGKIETQRLQFYEYDSSSQQAGIEPQAQEQIDTESSGKYTDSDFEARKRVADIASQSAQSDRNRAREHTDAIQPEDSITLDENLSVGRVSPQFNGGTSAFSAQSAELQDRSFAMIPSGEQTIGTLEPKWIADDTGTMQLVLVRSVMIDGKPVVQGVWMDWEALRRDLLESVSDVLPGSSLVPVSGAASSMSSVYQLATIPVAFIPAINQVVPRWRWSPATAGLLVTWIAIISTIIAVGAVLRAAIVLSERRGRFVSAVTHELRTPLTTFRLYSQMLADGMVSDEQVRTDYLSILKRESERLTGIVENVLEYARLTRQRSTKDKPAGVQTLSPGALIARFRPALARRAQQSNLDLVVSMDLEDHKDRTLTIDPHAVERIMMNLVENACKYAAPVDPESEETSIEDVDTRIHLDVTVRNDTLELLVADHGHGIAPGEGARIFGEFQRGWRGLSNARSGLGLGLALSRGLAREMDGDLVLTRRRGHGAEFLLTIPLDDKHNTD